MSKSQTTILIVLGVLVVVVYCGLGHVVLTNIRDIHQQSSIHQIAPTAIPIPTTTPIPTWTPTATLEPAATWAPRPSRTPTPTSMLWSTIKPWPTSTPTGPRVVVPTQAPAIRRRCGAVCRDGWRSNATGRGACSHHGGVAYWVYCP